MGVAKLLFLRVGHEPERNYNGLLARALGNADFSSDRVTDPGANAESFRRAHGPSDHSSDARADVFSDDYANIASNNRAPDACADNDADVDANDAANGTADHAANARSDVDSDGHADVEPNDSADSPANRLALHGRRRQF